MNTEHIAEHLEVFVEVIRSGNFSEAARKLNLSASSVGRRMDLLEKALGTKLLVRTTHAVRLTEMGQAFYEKAQNILSEINQAKAALHSIVTEPEGLLRVDCPINFGRLHMAPAVADFLSLYPGIEVDLILTESFSDARGTRVGEEVDVGIRVGTVEETRLIATVLAPQIRVACASPVYLQHHGTPAHPLELIRHKCLTWSGTGPTGAWRFGRGKQARVYPISVRMKSNSSDVLLTAALKGNGIAHLPTWLCGEAIQRGELVPLFLEGRAAESDGTAIHALRLEGTKTSKTTLFIDFLKKRFSKPAWLLDH